MSSNEARPSPISITFSEHYPTEATGNFAEQTHIYAFKGLEINNKPIPGSGISATLTQHAGPVTVGGNILAPAATGNKLRLCWTADDNEVVTVYQQVTEQTPEIYSAHVVLETIRS